LTTTRDRIRRAATTRNDCGLAHESGSIESSHGHLKRAIETLCFCAARAISTRPRPYRRFVDEVVGRRNARNRKRLDLERPARQGVPENPP
jgi:hypothetical protein